VSLYAQIRAFIEQLVHVSARRDPLTAARHRAFIAPRMIGGLLALTALPVHLAINGVPVRSRSSYTPGSRRRF
jgi:cell cycle sensor histidine kinase DivJ